MSEDESNKLKVLKEELKTYKDGIVRWGKITAASSVIAVYYFSDLDNKLYHACRDLLASIPLDHPKYEEFIYNIIFQLEPARSSVGGELLLSTCVAASWSVLAAKVAHWYFTKRDIKKIEKS